MKKMFLAIIGMVLVAIVAFVVKKSNQDYRYVLLKQDGTIVKGTKPLKFEDLKWRDAAGFGHQVAIPTLDGLPVLCKIGDEKGPLYTYHPFTASKMTDFDHNATTLPCSDIDKFLPDFKEMKSEQELIYQTVVKCDRKVVGSVGNLNRDLVEGKVSLYPSYN